MKLPFHTLPIAAKFKLNGWTLQKIVKIPIDNSFLMWDAINLDTDKLATIQDGDDKRPNLVEVIE